MDCSGCDVSSCACVVDLSGAVVDLSGAVIEMIEALAKLSLPQSDEEEDIELCPVCKKPWVEEYSDSDSDGD
jgi:hypothetical protein